MTGKKNKKRNFYKIFLQLSILVLLFYMGARILSDRVYVPDFETYCPFGGIMALSSYFVIDSLACTMTSTQIMMGLLLVVSIMIFGKLFCGYICPVGTVSEYLGIKGRTGIYVK